MTTQLRATFSLLFITCLFSCDPRPPSTACASDAECGAGRVCQQNLCVTATPVASECAAGESRACGNAAVGACKQGTQRCVDGKFATSCTGEVKPGTEVCNEVDDDCDGQIDEGVTQSFFVDTDGDGFGVAGPGTVAACTKPPGTAPVSGDCDDRAGSGASIFPGATEICDAARVDENCNGASNEGCGGCTAGMTQQCCAGRGSQRCEATDAGTVLSSCSVIATVEVCNGVDDDCDGQIDEQALLTNFDGGALPVDGGLAMPDGTCRAGLGQCLASGTTTCTSTGLVCMVLTGSPRPESCNGLDDDCDGLIDNGPIASPDGGMVQIDAGVGAPDGTCRRGVGACASVGVTNCAGVGALVCVAPPETGPSTELCNGLDDDCDGATDEDLGTQSCGQGTCARTVQACLNGAAQSCTPGTPGTETCNGLDDDCDGTPDDGLGSQSCGMGTCARTVQTCVNGAAQSCTPGTPGTETCNGVDDDCDGATDEGVQIACSADADGDLYATNTATTMLCADAARAAAGFCPVGFVAPASSLGLDCDPNAASRYRVISSRADADNDTLCTGPATNDCVGTSALPGRRFETACNVNTACNDNDGILYRFMNSRTDADGDSYCSGASTFDCVGATPLPGRRFEGACLAPDDCSDANATVFRNATVRADADNDAYCAGAAQTLCIGNAPPAGLRITTSCQGEDCRDSNAAATTQCLLVNQYSTSSHVQTCPNGAQTFSVIAQTFCPLGFTLTAWRAQVSSGAGFCAASSPTTVVQTCNFLEGTTCRILGDCTAN